MSETAPSTYEIVARAGDTLTRVLTWLENDQTTPVDLTGASVEWSLTSGATEYQYEDNAQASVTDATAGEITLTLTPTLTRALYGSAWRYEVTVTLVDGARTTLLDGHLTVLKEVLA